MSPEVSLTVSRRTDLSLNMSAAVSCLQHLSLDLSSEVPSGLSFTDTGGGTCRRTCGQEFVERDRQRDLQRHLAVVAAGVLEIWFLPVVVFGEDRGVRGEVTDDVEEFLDSTGDFLRSRPVEHNLVLSIAELNRGDHARPSRWAWAADRSGPVTGVLIQSPATFIATVTPMPPAATEALVARLNAEVPDLPGVSGDAATVARFAGEWASTRRVPAPVAGQRLYELGSLTPPDGVTGALRRARPADVATLTAWDDAFSSETGLERPAADDRAALIARRVDDGMFWVWEADDGIVSMAFSSPPVAGSARIGAVYTPPNQRGHGYVSACVAAINTELLATGLRHSVLYTQLVNPISNRVYQRLGYQPVAEILAYRFG